MPRLRRRIQAPRPECDCAECRGGSVPFTSSSAAAAAARQDPPPRCLILVVDDCLVADGPTQRLPPKRTASGRPHTRQNTLDTTPTPHLDSLAKWGSSGLLAVRDMGAGDLALTLQVLTYCAEHVDDIDMSGAPGIPPEGGPARADSGVVAQQQWQRVGERFKAFRSLEAACCSTEARVSAVARRAGFADASECLDAPDGALPSTETFARRVAGALGFATGEHFLSPAGIAGGMFGGARLGDLLVAHVGKSCRLRGTDDGEGSAAGRHIGEDGAGSGRDEGVGTGGSDGAGLGDAAGGGLEGGATQERARGLLEWTDEVVRELLCLPGIREQLVICVVLGQTGLEEEACVGLPHAGGTTGPMGFRPLQSFECVGDKCAGPFREAATALIIQRLPGVIRVDGCRRACLGEASTLGAGGCILAERVLHEIAYKMGCTYKYGQ